MLLALQSDLSAASCKAAPVIPDTVERGEAMAVARSADQYDSFAWALPVEMEGNLRGCGGTGDDDDDDYDVAPAA
ncbi:unnamed protein product [Urochloa humidicola]